MFVFQSVDGQGKKHFDRELVLGEGTSQEQEFLAGMSSAMLVCAY
jgi:hypothetical protein